jgi:RNA polymerase sigma-70 factor (sigma-E family)
MMTRDTAEFGEYVALRWPPMIRTARLLTGDDGLAEDLVQTALEKCYVAWPRLRARDATDVYVRRTIVNTFISWQRRRSWHELPRERMPEPAGVDPTADVPQRSMLQSALAELAPRQRAVVVLRFFEDLSVRQVADELGCSTGTVKSQTSDALERLRELLGDEIDELESESHTEGRSRR